MTLVCTDWLMILNHKAMVEDLQKTLGVPVGTRVTHIYLWIVSGPRADWKRRERCLMYPYIHSQHVPHYIWTSSTLFRYLLQSFQRSGSFFSDFARSHLIFFFLAWLLSSADAWTFVTGSRWGKCRHKINIISLRRLSPPKKKNLWRLWASAAEKGTWPCLNFSRALTDCFVG